MADIWQAYKVLNESFGLKLTDEQLFRAEQMFKQKFLAEQGYSRTEIENVDNWEFFSHVAPIKTELKPLVNSLREALQREDQRSNPKG